MAYGGAPVVRDVSLVIGPGKLVALLGPSGCGKTTLLRAIAGFIRPRSGCILFDGLPVDHLTPGQRQIGIVFQNYALFPQLSVRENVAYGLRARGVRRVEVMPRVEAALDAVQMRAFAERLPRALSGGQQQRVSLARAVVTEPAVLLLDEPFAALDRSLRLDLQLEIRRLQRRLALTAVMVTHDQDEAMSMADEMAVMRAGGIEQVGEPAAIYDRPGNLFVAGFVGASVAMQGRVLGTADDCCTVQLDTGARFTIPLAPGVAAALAGGRVVLSARPEHLVLHDTPADDRVPAMIRQSAPIGAMTVHDIGTASGALDMKVTEPRHACQRRPGPIHVGLAPGAQPALFPQFAPG